MLATATAAATAAAVCVYVCMYKTVRQADEGDWCDEGREGGMHAMKKSGKKKRTTCR